ncbi:MAG: histidinol-phosphate transaminase [Planctomycetaceae bacterium]|nr:histidinol-phosphate transaminase [Planctomycetaceae bacterium]
MRRFFLPRIDAMTGYTPGEQPRDADVVKLNTNENPYPPSPRVAEAIASALDDRLRLYPDPVATAFRRVAARLHGVEPDMILAGNGSDDLLTIITRAFVAAGDLVVYPMPSYPLYRTLSELQGARESHALFSPEWGLDPEAFAVPGARLAYLANPNSPSGTALPPEQVAALAGRLDCPLVVDEAYADFAQANAIGLVAEYPNVIVTRSLSKGYGLAGLRLGYLVARPEIVAGLRKVKDPYNCDTLSLVGGAAALEDQDYLAQTRARILATRRRMAEAVRALKFHVPESQANFLWLAGGPPAGELHQELKGRKVLVRLMRYPGLTEGLRISVGTDAEVDLFLKALRAVV